MLVGRRILETVGPTLEKLGCTFAYTYVRVSVSVYVCEKKERKRKKDNSDRRPEHHDHGRVMSLRKIYAKDPSNKEEKISPR